MSFDPDKIFSLSTEGEFEKFALELFHYQYELNPVYQEYCKAILKGKQPTRIESIPFLPIQFFKSFAIKTGSFNAEKIYTSSSTSGTGESKHHVKSVDWYLKVCRKAFEYFYGPLNQYQFIALLPSYLERQGSSLIDMVEHFIQNSSEKLGGFYLNDYPAILTKMEEAPHLKTLIIGVTFGLLDWAEQHPTQLTNTLLMETGGMKGRRKEMIRPEVQEILQKAFHQSAIHSEYGMTELLSQAYSKGAGLFSNPPWMRVLTREYNDPFIFTKSGKTGGLNIIDLANIDSCAFIQTQDLGKIHANNTFEVLGRFDHSDTRGCNLMVH